MVLTQMSKEDKYGGEIGNHELILFGK